MPNCAPSPYAPQPRDNAHLAHSASSRAALSLGKNHAPSPDGRSAHDEQHHAQQIARAAEEELQRQEDEFRRRLREHERLLEQLERERAERHAQEARDRREDTREERAREARRGR